MSDGKSYGPNDAIPAPNRSPSAGEEGQDKVKNIAGGVQRVAGFLE